MVHQAVQLAACMVHSHDARVIDDAHAARDVGATPSTWCVVTRLFGAREPPVKAQAVAAPRTAVAVAEPRVVDMEGSQSIITEPATVRAEYKAQLKHFLGKLRDDCHEFNADYRRVTLDQPYGEVMANFLTERARHSTRA